MQRDNNIAISLEKIKINTNFKKPINLAENSHFPRRLYPKEEYLGEL
jgi:hypothetical protein